MRTLVVYFCTPNLVLNKQAEVAHLVEHNLAKVGVAGSSPVFRSESPDPRRDFFSVAMIPDIWGRKYRVCPGGGIGRHAGLKILFAEKRVRVQVPPGAHTLCKLQGVFYFEDFSLFVNSFVKRFFFNRIMFKGVSL
ncbi:MAG: hypothetical protein RIR90_988 [Bacteroidota bacterium]